MCWSSSKEKCPVCDKSLSVSTDYMDSTLMEEHKVCDHCDRYRCSYVTGGTQIIIDGRQWSWCYLTEWEEIEAINNRITKYIEGMVNE